MATVTDDGCLDLLFCLALLEANTARGEQAPVLNLYLDLLNSLRELRDTSGDGWTTASTSERLGEQALAALSWIRQSCRSELHALGPLAINDVDSSPLLFWVASGPTERERHFQELKGKHGSTFAFHGSAPGNWASILRHGLRSLSGTSRQAHGAVHGDGVYLSTQASIAAPYAGFQTMLAGCKGRTDSKTTLLDPFALRILALCEVVVVPAPGLNRKDNIWVASQDGIVAVRLLIVFPQGAMPRGTAPSIEKLLEKLPSRHLGSPDDISQLAVPRTMAAPPSFPVISVAIPKFIRQGGQSRGSYWAFCIQARCAGESAALAQSVLEGSEGIWRRYSQFELLRDRIGHGPRAPFPAKLAVRSSFFGLNQDQLETRRKELEHWLREVISVAGHGLLREELCPELCAFLGAWVTRKS